MAGRNQTEVGQALDVSFQQIQKYENGTTSISLDRLYQLAGFLSIPVPRLVDVAAFGGETARVAESEQAPYASEQHSQPAVGPLSRDAVALVKAFNDIESKKLRRAILTMVQGYANGSEAERGDPPRL